MKYYYMTHDPKLPIGTQTLYDGLYDHLITEQTEVDKKKHCWHEWKKYIGFTEKYEFCIKCEEKREFNE